MRPSANKTNTDNASNFWVESKRRSLEKLARLYPDAFIIDVTSHGLQPWVKFSPFYPHGNIPILNSPRVSSASVEGIWQGLKVFEKADIDVSKFNITTMTGIKRSSRTFGKVIGHRAGIDSMTILTYREARHRIYLPTYQWVLEHYLLDEVQQLMRLGENQPVVLLDYETNADIENLTKPLSHAALINKFILKYIDADDSAIR